MSTRTARRLKVFRAANDGWRWLAQGQNWATIDQSSRAYTTHGKARAAASRRYPEAEVVVER